MRALKKLLSRVGGEVKHKNLVSKGLLSVNLLTMVILPSSTHLRLNFRVKKKSPKTLQRTHSLARRVEIAPSTE